MKIQQAIFTSSDRGQIKGYQLVAVSDDMDRDLSRKIQLWSPSHLGETPAKWTVNYYPISQDQVAVTRTALGGPEYSGRGGAQVVTLIAVLNNHQFSAYDNNAILVARTALALGWLRIPSHMPSRLQPIELPDVPLPACRGSYRFNFSTPAITDPIDRCSSISTPRTRSRENRLDDRVLTGLMELLKKRRRIAIVGARNPLHMVDSFIQHLPLADRREFSFTTGLPPTYNRPFQAHFLTSASPTLAQSLKSEGIVLVDIETANLTASDCLAYLPQGGKN